MLVVMERKGLVFFNFDQGCSVFLMQILEASRNDPKVWRRRKGVRGAVNGKIRE